MAVIGYGYWGPNLARNIAAATRAELCAIADKNASHRARAIAKHPAARIYEDPAQIFSDPEIDAVVIATPVATHFELAKAALLAEKHVLVEKPLTNSLYLAEALASLAHKVGRVLMVDHTFIYTGAVRILCELVKRGELGRILYFDSVRINLGRFQPDVNVIWDLAPHDLSIMDVVLTQSLGATARWVSAIGAAHYGPYENMAYVTVGFDDGLISHLHLNWMAPVKTRRTILAGDKRMVVWDDSGTGEPIQLFDSAVHMQRSPEGALQPFIAQYRTGEVSAPKLDPTEALSVMVDTFAGACLDAESSPSDARAALRVIRILEAAHLSINQKGARIDL